MRFFSTEVLRRPIRESRNPRIMVDEDGQRRVIAEQKTVGHSTVKQYKAALVQLYNEQKNLGLNPNPQPVGHNLQNLLDTHRQRENARRKDREGGLGHHHQQLEDIINNNNNSIGTPRRRDDNTRRERDESDVVGSLFSNGNGDGDGNMINEQSMEERLTEGTTDHGITFSDENHNTNGNANANTNGYAQQLDRELEQVSPLIAERIRIMQEDIIAGQRRANIEQVQFRRGVLEALEIMNKRLDDIISGRVQWVVQAKLSQSQSQAQSQSQSQSQSQQRQSINSDGNLHFNPPPPSPSPRIGGDHHNRSRPRSSIHHPVSATRGTTNSSSAATAPTPATTTRTASGGNSTSTTAPQVPTSGHHHTSSTTTTSSSSSSSSPPNNNTNNNTNNNNNNNNNTNLPQTYSLSRTVKTVPDLWQEWTEGIDGGPAVSQLETAYGTSWRRAEDRMFFSRRRNIVSAVEDMVRKGGSSPVVAVAKLESVRQQKNWALNALAEELKKGEFVF